MNKKEPIYPVEPWCVTETEFTVTHNYRNETTFALSNGYIGTRGTYLEGYDFDEDTGMEGNYINGCYESEPIRYGEWNYGFPTMSQTMLNLPDCKRVEITVDGERMDLRQGKTSSYSRTLHLDRGNVTRSFVWTSPAGRRVRFSSTQLVCLERKHVMAVQLSVEPLNFAGSIELTSVLNANVVNHTRKTNPLVDYGPFGRCLEKEALSAEGGTLFYRGSTRHSGLTMACAVLHECGGNPTILSGDLTASVRYSGIVGQNQPLILTKYIGYVSSADVPPAEMRTFLLEQLMDARDAGFERLLYEQRSSMGRFWSAADVRMDDEALQQGMRFNLFHIMQAAGRDGRTGMGAKGLSGEGYEGHYFWDTEIYVMPLLIWTAPELAKNLLLYRHQTLPQARERAKVLGHPKGALFPWRTINGEEASTYFPLGTAQYHINGDVAYAVWQYWEVTGDYAFLRDYGAEILVETARVWADVGCFAECRDGKYCICAVTGPDEYNAIVDNNFYTNYLAKENLLMAIRALAVLGDDGHALRERLNITDDEITLWQRVADDMYLPFDRERRVFLQDDGYLMRKPYDESQVPVEKRHLLYENYHPLFVYRQRMSKQADTILALQLFSAHFTDEELRRNYDYYQTVTLHHSSLSTCVFGMLACRVGRTDDAVRYFADSARMDLDDYHDNFYAGIHAANMAGTWQTVVFGFGGLRLLDGMPEFSPQLPEGWRSYSFSVRFHGAVVRLEITQGRAVFTLENEVPVAFLVSGRRVSLDRKGETHIESI